MTDALRQLRDRIDATDDAILSALAERVRLARAVALEKRAAGLPIVDPAREAAVVEHAAERARALGLNESEVRAFYWRLLALSRREQLEQAEGYMDTAGGTLPPEAD